MIRNRFWHPGLARLYRRLLLCLLQLPVQSPWLPAAFHLRSYCAVQVADRTLTLHMPVNLQLQLSQLIPEHLHRVGKRLGFCHEVHGDQTDHTTQCHVERWYKKAAGDINKEVTDQTGSTTKDRGGTVVANGKSGRAHVGWKHCGKRGRYGAQLHNEEQPEDGIPRNGQTNVFTH